MASSPDVVQLIESAAQGDRTSLDALLPLIYGELRQMARSQLRRMSPATIGTTGLVHEAYMKMAGGQPMRSTDRAAFFAYASRAMRNVLLDDARSRQRLKRGGDFERREEDELALLPDASDGTELIALSSALDQLEEKHERLARVVELHVFGGLEFLEIAECLQITERTVFRDWKKAKALLSGLLDISDTDLS